MTIYKKVCEYCGAHFESMGPRALLCDSCKKERYKKPEHSAFCQQDNRKIKNKSQSK